MSTLITGASGFIGRRLWQPGDLALMRSASAVSGAKLGDLQEPTSLIKACADVDTIFHCAGYAHAFNSSDTEAHWRINFEGTRNLLNAAGKARVRRFVFLSSVKSMAEPGDECVDEDWPGEPETHYGKAKRAAEDAVLEAGEKFGMHVVNLRLAMVYGRGGKGNLDRMARGIKAGWFPPLPETGNRRSLVHVDDVVGAMRCVVENAKANGQTYIVAERNAYSGRQIYDTMRTVMSKPSLQWYFPTSVLKTSGILGDILGALLSKSLPVNSEVVTRLLSSACYSSALIERDLGWSAKVGLLDGLKEMLGNEANI